MSQLTVELVAADRQVWQGEANRVVARTTEGDIGILPGHAPLLSVLVDGEVRIDAVEGGNQVSEISGGFISVDSDRVTLVCEDVTAPTSA